MSIFSSHMSEAISRVEALLPSEQYHRYCPESLAASQQITDVLKDYLVRDAEEHHQTFSETPSENDKTYRAGKLEAFKKQLSIQPKFAQCP